MYAGLACVSAALAGVAGAEAALLVAGVAAAPPSFPVSVLSRRGLLDAVAAASAVPRSLSRRVAVRPRAVWRRRRHSSAMVKICEGENMRTSRWHY